ncbi:HdeD family acid-resistance protein [Nocardiopsis kunsanensis]|uniref:HdeD family acid-resistance protein n=1 Tax=Nocardiopsis kunsanensis TaxID=141693 RepID=UPI000360F0E4|nr:HdeD family acid-resistance protein [Nocardiopsis kunsanensis]
MVGYELPGGLLGHLSRNWWLVVLRGVAAVVFGILALLWPGLTLVALAVAFGVYALVDAGAVGYAALRAERGTRAPLVVQSVLTLVVGLVALLWPLAAVVALVFVVGAWAIITGVGEIITAVRLRARISSEWLLIFVGALSVIFGLLLWFWPLEGAQALVFVVGIYAIVFGLVLAVAGLRLRSADGRRKGSGDESSADEGVWDEGAEGGAGYVPGAGAHPYDDGPEHGGDLLARREDDRAAPEEDFEPGERFERPRRTGDEAPEAPDADRTFRVGEEREDARRSAPEEPRERPRRGRHRAPRRGD